MKHLATDMNTSETTERSHTYGSPFGRVVDFSLVFEASIIIDIASQHMLEFTIVVSIFFSILPI